MMHLIILSLILFNIFSMNKWFVYYCSTRALLCYLISEHGDCIDAKKARQLTDLAIERSIKEFFGKY